MNAWKEYMGVLLVLGVVALLVKNGDKASQVIKAAGSALSQTFATVEGNPANSLVTINNPG